MELRPYQQEAKDAIFEQWDSGVLKTLLVLPTGCGKTVVFAKVTEDCVRQGSRVLILAHRGELLDQAADKLKKTTGLGCAVEKAESSCQGTWFRVVVGSVQTLMREKRLSSFDSDYFDTIIIDEAHHCISDSYQRVLQHFSGAHVLGVTATPDRGDMKNLGTYFESLAYEYTLPKAIKEGYLSPIKALTIGCAVIYCHHHSKGSQGGKKFMDRASGSGVFARDPDALLDLTELEPTEALMKQEENKAICAACKVYLDAHFEWQDDLSQDDSLSSTAMMDYCREHLKQWQMVVLNEQIETAKAKVRAKTAWRIEGTLREFPKFEPVNLWFDYPVHRIDHVGSLKDLQLEAEKPMWEKAAQKRKENAQKTRERKLNEFEIAFQNIEFDGREISAAELAEALDTTSRELLSWLGETKRQKKELRKKFEKYIGDDGKAYIRRKGAQD